VLDNFRVGAREFADIVRRELYRTQKRNTTLGFK
jgi:hypothetical protein